MLATLKSGKPGRPLFGLSYPQLAKQFKHAVRGARLEALSPAMYQLRRGGPSHDRFRNLRSLIDVKRRGRWAADASLRRYDAHARLLQQELKLSLAIRRGAHLALARLESTLLACCSRPPPALPSSWTRKRSSSSLAAAAY